MIITRTPFRVSFFGGGTDIPAWFEEEGGQVLSTTIDKFCYVTLRELPPFFDHSIRVAYSRMETAREAAELKHPLIRAVLEGYGLNNVELHYDSDLPAQSGLGTSSSFAVGLVAAIHGLRGELVAPDQLASRAIHFERDVLKEAGGYQDQIAAAFGGLNHVRFHRGGWSVSPVLATRQRLEELHDRLLLFYVPIRRYSGDVSMARSFDKVAHDERLRFLHGTVDTALSILASGELDDFGRLLHESWVRKREFDHVTNATIDDAYSAALGAGALGGKLLGAGGGGFMLVYAPEGARAAVIEALSKLLVVPFAFESEGVRVIYYRR